MLLSSYCTTGILNLNFYEAKRLRTFNARVNSKIMVSPRISPNILCSMCLNALCCIVDIVNKQLALLWFASLCVILQNQVGIVVVGKHVVIGANDAV